MQVQTETDRALCGRIAELETRVAHPKHWSSGEHQINVEHLRQLRFQQKALGVVCTRL
tara:strand:+ start:271 stop:444 length:174 start_codon:yes stop_codon:yes gene_type:complete